MFITTIEIIANGEKTELEEKLNSSDIVADYKIDDINKNPRKNIILSFSNPVDTKYVAPALQTILN